MKIVICLKGGSKLEIDLSKYHTIISQDKIGIFLLEGDSKPYTVHDYNEWIIPFDLVEKIDL